MYAVVMDSKLHNNAITSPLQDKDLSQHSTPLSDVSVFHAAPTNVFFFFLCHLVKVVPFMYARPARRVQPIQRLSQIIFYCCTYTR